MAMTVDFATISQPSPTGDDKMVAPMVKADLARMVDRGVGVAFDVQGDVDARVELGRERHGTVLRINNGRSPIIDAYQEALDLIVYLRQAIEEGREDLGVAYANVLATCCTLRQACNELHLFHPSAGDNGG